MAQPRWTSLDPLVVTGDSLEIGRGNWQPGQDSGSQLDNPKWMAVIYVDGHHVRGTVPQMPSAPADRIYPGEISWDARLSFPLAPWKDGREHTATVRVYAASFFKGWGDAPEDRWEWGHGSAADERPAVLETRFKLGVPAPEPKPEPSPSPVVTLDAAQTKAINALYDLVEYRRSIGDSDEKIFGTLYYQVIRALGLPRGDGRRVKVAKAIQDAIAS